MTTTLSDPFQVRGVPLLEAFEKTVNENRDKVFGHWYDAQGSCVVSYSFGHLWDEAGSIAHYLDLQKCQRVVLCYDFGLHFFASFLGCLRAGVTAVLVYPPHRPLAPSLRKMRQVVDSCEPDFILTDSRVAMLRSADLVNPLSKSRGLWPSAKWVVTDRLPKKAWVRTDTKDRSEDIAFLQYTSGSTGDPKGVMVSYQALAMNVALAAEQFYQDAGQRRECVGFSWLPQYHDFGLVIGMVLPFWAGWSMHYMSPIVFVQNPVLWFELISRQKVYWSLSPDFGLHLLCRKFDQGSVKSKLDLSCLRAILNGAEPIRSTTNTLVNTTFQAYGLSDNWHAPVYGLAEHVVFGTIFNGNQFSTETDEVAGGLVAVGYRPHISREFNLQIVDPMTNESMPDGRPGELWISSPCVTAGYFGRPNLSEEAFCARIEGCETEGAHLRTGDMAFFQDDYLYICGRIKDMIICNGVNYYPQDIELCVQESTTAVRPGCVAAFAASDTGEDGRIVVVFEIRKEAEHRAAEICKEAKKSISVVVGVSPYRVIAIKERTICKTTSGKIKRRAVRDALLAYDLVVVHDMKAAFDLGPRRRRSVEGTRKKFGSFDDLMATFFGEAYDSEKDWEELGLTSLESVELRRLVDETCCVALPPDCFEVYATPVELFEYVCDIQGKPFPIAHTQIEKLQGGKVSRLVCSALQGVGFVLNLLLFSLCIAEPAFHVGDKLANSNTQEVFLVFGGVPISWIWLPFAVPAFMVSYTVVVVLMKWLVVGRYRAIECDVSSTYYLRWWIVDRALEYWEMWVGRFIVETPVIWLVYRILGARLHPTVSVDAYIREFDLVQVDANASVEHSIRCRIFSGYEPDGSGPVLRFGAVTIGANAVVKGMVSPDVSVGAESVVCKLSVVAEGSQIPKGRIARGNLAFDSGPSLQEPESQKGSYMFQLLKVVWLCFELYIFFSGMLVGQILWNDRLPIGWRYRELLYWVLLIATSNVTMLTTTIVLKWLVIGKRRTGPIRGGRVRALGDWIVDYHFRASKFLLHSILMESSIWNLFAMAMGMDVDFWSKIDIGSIPPSKADLVSVRNAFLSDPSFCVKHEGHYVATRVHESSLGFGVYVGPGVSVVRSIVPPYSYVAADLVRDSVDPRSRAYASWQVLATKMVGEVLFVIFIASIAFSLVPSFEVWLLCDPQKPIVAVPVLMMALVTQTLSWLALVRTIQALAYCRGYSKRPAFPIFMILQTATWALQVFSLLPLMWGTPMILTALQFLGATVEGHEVIFNGLRVYDFWGLSIANKTVIDNALTLGHQVVYSDLQVGPMRLSGLYHSFSTTVIGSHDDVTEKSPWRAYVGSKNTASPIICPSELSKSALFSRSFGENGSRRRSTISAERSGLVTRPQQEPPLPQQHCSSV